MHPTIKAMAASVSQKEYLKKYLSGADKKEKKKKKKVSKHLKDSRVKIVDDDDVGPTTVEQLSDEDKDKGESELYDDPEERPQVAGVVDERPELVQKLEEFHSSKWRTLTEDGQGRPAVENIYQDKLKETLSTVVREKSKRKSDKKNGSSHNDSRSSSGRKRHDSDNGRNNTSDSSRHKRSDSKKSEEKSERRSTSQSSSRKRHDSDKSPVRKRHDSDASPPRKRHDSDASPPRQRHDSDASPPRKRHDSDNSPPRQRHDSDKSPPRKRRDSDASPPRKRDSDVSPPRKRRDSDVSPPRKRRNSDMSPPRKRRDSDVSPPRKRRDSDQSPPRNNSKHSDSGSRHSQSKDGKMTKTLEGKKAGLQDARTLRIENDEHKRREMEQFDKLDDSVSGRRAATVRRDKKTGKRIDVEAERKKKQEEDEKKAILDQKYKKWNAGVAQVENRKKKLEEDLHEMSKPLARYAGDEDLEVHLKDQERDGDPMLDYIRKKKGKDTPGKPRYSGPMTPNRFGIIPGIRWDGVDRSNGYEKEFFKRKNQKKAGTDDSYKWSTEDM